MSLRTEIRTEIGPLPDDVEDPIYPEMVFGAPKADRDPLVRQLRGTIEAQREIIHLQESNIRGNLRDSLRYSLNYAVVWGLLTISAAYNMEYNVGMLAPRVLAVAGWVGFLTAMGQAEINWKNLYQEEMFTSLPRKLIRHLKQQWQKPNQP